MDPISFCALCPTMQWFGQCLSGAWPPPFDKLALEWRTNGGLPATVGTGDWPPDHSFQKHSTRPSPRQCQARILPCMPKTLPTL